MKPTAPVVWIVFALLSAGILLLADPFTWFGEDGPAEPFAPSSADDPGAIPRAEARPIAATPATTEETIERQVVDRLVAAGLASFRILAPGGQPVAGAQVLVVRDGDLLCDQRTDVNGEMELAADARTASLFVAVERRPLERHGVLLEVGRQDILLAEGHPLSGRFLTADGGSPGRLRITIDSDHPLPTIPSLPPVVQQALGVQALRGAYFILETDEQGRFGCDGLPASWSGRLWPRGGWRVESTSHGDLLPLARGIRLAEPRTDLIVRIAAQETLRGRLVLRDDGSPLGGARLSSMLRSPDARSPTLSSTVTDEAGHFEIEVRQARISTFELHLGARFHDSPSILARNGTELPADGDLGDVVVYDVRHVPFLLQDTEGAPIAHGVAIAAGTRSAQTGRDGRGELRWLVRSASRLVAEAEGFVPTGAEIPPVVLEPLVVTMAPASELLVSLRLPTGADPGQFKLVLRGEERITAVPVTDRADQRRHVSEWAWPLVELVQTAEDSYLCGSPDPKGRVTFRALRPGVEMELRVCGMTGGMVYHSRPVAPLATAEHREIEVSLEGGMIVFRGHVLDQDGNPLVRAIVQLGGQILDFTDDEGAFLSYLATADTGTLLIQHRNCSTRYLRDYQVPTHGQPVEFRLRAARPVTIEVVDRNGAPVPQAEVRTGYAGFTTNTHHITGNRHLASSVPDAPFEIIVRLAGREYRQQHDPSLPDARVVVPVHGRVVGLVADAATRGRAGQFVLALVPPQGEAAGPVTGRRASTSGLRIEIPAVHPGTYQASLRYLPSAEERDAGREASGSEPVPVVVQAGRETEVHLVFPADGR